MMQCQGGGFIFDAAAAAADILRFLFRVTLPINTIEFRIFRF